MFKTSSLAIAVVLVGVSAASAQRVSSTTMSCAQAAAYVQSQGSTVLGTGGMTYDRFVSDRRFCAPTESTKAAFAPTRDTQYCPIGYTCFERFTSQSDPSPK